MKLQRHLLGGWLTALALAVAAACGPAGAGTARLVPSVAATAAATTFEAASATPSVQDPVATTPASPTVAPYPVGTLTASATPGPSVASSPTPCTETQGQFSAVAVPSTVLGYGIDTRLYLPPCYALSGRLYPVLYLVHGLNYAEDQWQRLGIGAAADKLIAAGEIAPLIIVLPRDRDDARLDPAFVVDLVPYVDGHYRTLASAGYRAIGGMSRGGGWSIHLGLRYPNVFGRVGAHSPAIFLGDENNVLKYIRAAAKNGTAPALYLDVGDSDNQSQSAVWLDQMFTAFKFPHKYVVQPGGHDERYWGAHLDDYLRFYAAAWRPAPPPSATPIPSPTRRFQ